jgi:hypothetical protein
MGRGTNMILMDALRQLLNQYNEEQESNSPDHVLARDAWYGVHLEPGRKFFKELT